jgi:predicted metal-binding membrane protein
MIAGSLDHLHATGASGYLAATGMWLVMMAAMMVPAVMPWLRMFAAMATDAYPGRRRAAVVGQFAGGYLVAWLAYSAVAAALQARLHDAALIGLDLRASAILGGALLIVAGLFQLTPLKEACLTHCRSPLSFFLARWDGRAGGPFRMGLRHGIWCVGCCWALMALAFVLGAMNLLWMAALTLLVVLEQRMPRRWRLARASGVVLCVWGALRIVAG